MGDHLFPRTRGLYGWGTWQISRGYWRHAAANSRHGVRESLGETYGRRASPGRGTMPRCQAGSSPRRCRGKACAMAKVTFSEPGNGQVRAQRTPVKGPRPQQCPDQKSHTWPRCRGQFSAVIAPSKTGAWRRHARRTEYVEADWQGSKKTLASRAGHTFLRRTEPVRRRLSSA